MTKLKVITLSITYSDNSEHKVIYEVLGGVWKRLIAKDYNFKFYFMSWNLVYIICIIGYQVSFQNYPNKINNKNIISIARRRGRW